MPRMGGWLSEETKPAPTKKPDKRTNVGEQKGDEPRGRVVERGHAERGSLPLFVAPALRRRDVALHQRVHAHKLEAFAH